MQTILKALVLFLLLSLQSVFSGELNDVINSYDFKLHEPFLATFWGSCNAPKAKFDQKIIKETRSFVSSTLFKKNLPIAEFTFKDGDTFARPLTIINPGIFTDLKHNHGRLLSMRATEAGSNVVLIPNALGVEYLSSLPNFSPGDIEKEGQAVLEIAYKKIDEFKKKNIKISKVILLGVSYGSFLSAVAMAKDKEQKNLINQVLIFNPPLELGKGLINLDKSLDQTDDDYKFMENTFNILNVLRYCKKPDESKLDPSDLQKIKSLTAHLGFHSWLVKSLIQIKKNDASINSIPDSRFGFFSKKYRNWRRHVRFVKFINIVNPQGSIVLNGEKGNLIWWLDHVPEKEIFVLSSEDDFLVEGVARPERDWFFQTKNGGHFGIQPTQWFADLLKNLIVNY